MLNYTSLNAPLHSEPTHLMRSKAPNSSEITTSFAQTHFKTEICGSDMQTGSVTPPGKTEPQ